MSRVRPAFVLSLSLALILYAVPLHAQSGTVRIIQTNAAGDNAHVIDPTTNKVVEVIPGLPIAHGVTSAPDGSALYLSNEVRHTLDVVPTGTLRVSQSIPLTGRPNNVAITRDGRKVYVAITGADAFVDVDRLRDLAADGKHRIQRRHRLLEDHGDPPSADPSHVSLRERKQVLTVQDNLPANDLSRRIRDETQEGESGDRLPTP